MVTKNFAYARIIGSDEMSRLSASLASGIRHTGYGTDHDRLRDPDPVTILKMAALSRTTSGIIVLCPLHFHRRLFLLEAFAGLQLIL
jgi:hypothetical protein